MLLQVIIDRRLLCAILILASQLMYAQKSYTKIFYYDSSSINNHGTLSVDSNYTGSLFIQNIDFEGQDSWNDTNSKHATFPHEANFSKTVFSKTADFELCSFSHNAHFSNALFDGNADFSDADFNRDADFSNCIFSREANFENANFESQVSFNNCQFLGNVYFGEGSFSKANFTNSVFFKDVNCNGYFFEYATFSKDTFKNNLDFSGVTFEKGVDFSSCCFNSSVDLSDVTFSKNANFRDIKEKGECSIDFTEARLPIFLDFSYNHDLANEIDLTTSDFNTDGFVKKELPKNDSIKYHYINLFKSNITKFHIDYIHFRLVFYDSKNNSSLPNDEKRSIYEQLLKNFKDRGQEDSYEILDKEYKWFKEPIFLGFLEWIWWDFGYKKWLVFIWTIGFLFIFTLLTRIKLNYLQTSVYCIEIVNPLSKHLFWHSFLYTVSIFFPLSLKGKNFKSSGFGIIYVVLVYLSGILCVAYIANFIIQK